MQYCMRHDQQAVYHCLTVIPDLSIDSNQEFS